MPKLNLLHGPLYRTLTCLSILVLLIGQASAPTADPAPTPTPPATTPAEEAWEDWEARRGAAQAAPSEAGGAPEQPSQMQLGECYSYEPSKLRYTSVVYSGVDYYTYDENIYLHADMCGQSSYLQLTQVEGADYEPQLSPSGKEVVFVSNRLSPHGRVSNIYTMTNYGASQTRITNAGVNRMPSYSPDGRKIVFVSTRDGNAEIYVMNSDGTDQTRLTVSEDADVEPDWSPDGRLIVWSRRLANGMGVLYTMRPDGTGQRALLKPVPFAGQPRWSPSGSRLVFRLDADADGWYDLAIVNADGTNLTVLPISKDDPLTDFELGAWLPNEMGIIYSRIGYVWEGDWYITAASLSFFMMAADIYPVVDTYIPYKFTPHVQSLDDTPPVSKLQPLPEFSHYLNVPLEWSVTDNYSKPFLFTIEASSSLMPEWQYVTRYGLSYYTEPYRGSYTYTGSPGDTVNFRGKAVDEANNTEASKTTPDAWTKLYRWMMNVVTMDARERLLAGTQVRAAPAAMNETVTGMTGISNLYIANEGRYTVEASKPGYVTGSPARWLVTKDETFDMVLTWPDEQFTNGHFEDPELLAGWQQSGVIESAAAPGRYGGQGARLGSLCSSSFCFHRPTPLGAHDLASPGAAVAVDPLGAAHVRYEGNRYGVLSADGAIQPWPDLPVQGAYGPVRFDPDGRPYMMAEAQYIRWDGSAWVVEPAPFTQETALYYEMDAESRLHVLYGDNSCGGCLKYTRRSADGTWQPAILVSEAANIPASLSVEPGGTAHVVYGQADYIRILPDGTVTTPQHLPTGSFIEDIYTKYVNGRGLFVAYNQINFWQRLYLRTPSGVWTILYEGGGNGYARGLQADAAGNVYLLQQLETRSAISRIAAGSQAVTRYVTLDGIGPVFSFGAGPQGEPHIVYGEQVNGQFRYFYRRGVQGTFNGRGAIEQPVTIGADLHEPTLSFFYITTGGEDGSPSYFHVAFTPEGGQPISLFGAAPAPEWRHIWVDLTPYKGQSGVISFQLVQNDGARLQVTIDEASISSNMTPIITLVDPDPLALPVPAEYWVDLYGANIKDGAQVSIDGSPALAVERVDATHIRVLIPAYTEPGTHVVTVTNPGGAEASAALHTGLPSFLPLLRK